MIEYVTPNSEVKQKIKLKAFSQSNMLFKYGDDTYDKFTFDMLMDVYNNRTNEDVNRDVTMPDRLVRHKYNLNAKENRDFVTNPMALSLLDSK